MRRVWPGNVSDRLCRRVSLKAATALDLFPYLDDHRIYGMPVLPMTAAIAALCDDAAQRHFGTDAVALDNFQYRDALALPEAGERIVQA